MKTSLTIVALLVLSLNTIFIGYSVMRTGGSYETREKQLQKDFVVLTDSFEMLKIDFKKSEVENIQRNDLLKDILEKGLLHLQRVKK